MQVRFVNLTCSWFINLRHAGPDWCWTLDPRGMRRREEQSRAEKRREEKEVFEEEEGDKNGIEEAKGKAAVLTAAEMMD